jgi:hypothetical protein
MELLRDISTNEIIRVATKEEWQESIDASERDGGVGAINVDGVTCYVED